MSTATIRRFTSALALTLVAGGAAAQSGAESHAPYFPADITASCTPAARSEFDFAVAAYHAFAWQDMERALDQALRADSQCAMAHWMRALGALGAPSRWKDGAPPLTRAIGRIALDHAREAGLRTARERDYVEALSIMHADDGLDASARLKAFQESLARLARTYADAHAHALVALARRADCTEE